jgi:hypothetical protein
MCCLCEAGFQEAPWLQSWSAHNHSLILANPGARFETGPRGVLYKDAHTRCLPCERSLHFEFAGLANLCLNVVSNDTDATRIVFASEHFDNEAAARFAKRVHNLG